MVPIEHVVPVAAVVEVDWVHAATTSDVAAVRSSAFAAAARWAGNCGQSTASARRSDDLIDRHGCLAGQSVMASPVTIVSSPSTSRRLRLDAGHATTRLLDPARLPPGAVKIIPGVSLGNPVRMALLPNNRIAARAGSCALRLTSADVTALITGASLISRISLAELPATF